MKWLISCIGKSAAIIVVFLVFVLAFMLIILSPIAKYAIEKNSKEWVGRKITMNNFYFNVLNGKLSIDGLKLFEKDDQNVL